MESQLSELREGAYYLGIGSCVVEYGEFEIGRRRLDDVNTPFVNGGVPQKAYLGGDCGVHRGPIELCRFRIWRIR
jgi:hypothetical protein